MPWRSARRSGRRPWRWSPRRHGGKNRGGSSCPIVHPPTGIGRVAGANAEQVVRLMMGGGMRLVAIGAVVGLALSAAAARLLSGVLYGVNAADPIAFVVAPVVLIGVAVAAAWIPARRVTRINPVRAIRAD
ncbi:MAG: FtsX-like permease family protein [Gemmatimonadota bacterium]